MKQQKLACRIAIYLLGLFILAVGIVFAVNSNLGVSPISSLPYVVSQITEIQLGTCTTAILCVYLVIQIIILRRKFKPYQLLQIVTATVLGFFVDFAMALLGWVSIPTYPGRLLMLAISIVLIALGVYLFVGTKLINSPMEGLAVVISETWGKKTFPEVKRMLDCLVVVLAVLLSFVCLGTISGIREGTVLSAVLVGTVMKPMAKMLNPILHKLCF